MADEANIVPTGLVCPRCGSPTTGAEYCGTCGLHLTDEDELPTRERWEQLRVERATGPVRPPASGAAPLGERWASRSRNARIGILGAAIAAIAAIVLIVSLSGGGSDEEPSLAADAPFSEPEPLPEERCVERWNGTDETFTGKSSAARFAQRGEVVATVGFSRDFPDRCQIVIAAPDLGTGLVQVYRESSGDYGGPFQLLTGGSVTSLPDSAKQWNARVSSDGDITLGYP